MLSKFKIQIFFLNYTLAGDFQSIHPFSIISLYALIILHYNSLYINL